MLGGFVLVKASYWQILFNDVKLNTHMVIFVRKLENDNHYYNRVPLNIYIYI